MIDQLKLDPNGIIETLSLLEKRIGDRFPKSGLRKVANELLDLAKKVGPK